MATLNIKENRHGNKYYELQYTQGGKQHRDTIGYLEGAKRISPHEARIALDAKNLELRTGKKLFTGSRPFDDFAAEYLTWHANEYPASHFRVAYLVRDAVLGQCDAKGRPFFAGRLCSALEDEPQLIERWKAARQQAKVRVRDPKNGGMRETKRTLAPSTVAKEVRQFRAMCKQGVKWGWFTKDPAAHVKPPPDLRSKVRRYYDDGQLRRLFALPLHGAHWEWIAHNGLRRGEACKVLTHGQVHVAKREIHIDSEPTKRTKSGKHRVVPMTPEGVAAYKRIYKAAQLAFRELNGRLPTAAELADQPVLPKMNLSSWSRAFRRDRDRLKLPPIKGSLVHALRHSYGAHAAMSGVDLRSLQEILGHASIETTEQYAEVAQAHLHKQVAKVKMG